MSEEDYRQYRGDGATSSSTLDLHQGKYESNDTTDSDFEPSKRRKLASKGGRYIKSFSPFVITSSDEENSYATPPLPSYTGKGKGKMNLTQNVDSEATRREDTFFRDQSSRHTSFKNCSCEKIKDLFKCFVCSCMVKSDPFLLICCGHLACTSCITQWALTNSTCPLCRKSIDPSTRPPLPRSLIVHVQHLLL